MDKYQDTMNSILKVQMDNFLDIFSRIFLDSFFTISRDISEANMTLHFHNKQYEADLKLVSSFNSLYVKNNDDDECFLPRVFFPSHPIYQALCLTYFSGISYT